MRLFIGIPLPKDIRESVGKSQQSLNEVVNGKFVEFENLHLTLRFLGEVEDVKSVEEKIAKITSKYKKFKVNLDKLGAFPSRDYVRIVWVGVSEGKECIKSISNDLNKAFGGEREEEGHITLVRVKSVKNRSNLNDLLDEKIDFGSFEVREINLIESKLQSSGPIYKVIKSFRLK